LLSGIYKLGSNSHFQQKLKISKANISETTGQILINFEIYLFLCTTYLPTEFKAIWWW